MSDFKEMDFERNSRGIQVVRAVRVRDIMKALRCSLSFAYQVIREIRGPAAADGTLAFVLPSQLAEWAYRRATGGSASPVRTMRAPGAGDRLLTLKRAGTAVSNDGPFHLTAPRTKPRGPK